MHRRPLAGIAGRRCALSTARHPLLTFLAWQAIGLSLLLAHIGAVVLTGSLVLPIIMTAFVVIFLYVANPLAGFAVLLQIVLYQNVCVSLISGSLTPKSSTPPSGRAFC